MTAEPGVLAGAVRARVVRRALGAANERATSRVDRFLDAAFELLGERSPCTDFSVNEVVERSGHSLRTFYGCYRSRHELLLAMLEDAVAATTHRLAAETGRDADPLDRLRRLVVGLHRSCHAPATRDGDRPLPPALVLHLLGADPVGTGRLLEPLVDLLEGSLREAADVGSVSRARRPRSVAANIVQVVMLDQFSGVIAPAEERGGDAAEEVWALIQRGLGASFRQGGNRRG